MRIGWGYGGQDVVSPKARAATLIAAGSVAAAVLGGCGASAGSSTPKKPYTIAMVPGTTNGPFYLTMQKGAEAEAKKLGVDLLWQGSTTASAEAQIPVVQTLLARHPDALIIAPDDATALIQPIKQFTQAHIPVLAVDTTISDAQSPGNADHLSQL